jgi:hypothetical protein
MKALSTRLLAAASLSLACAICVADDRPYTEGAVTEVSYIRTKPGMFDEYMKWVATQRKQEMEELKKAGIIVSYAIYAAQPRGPQDPDLIFTVTYKNMAALDGLDEKTDPIDKKIFGSTEAANKATVNRAQMRDVLGSELVRELKLK